MRQVSSNASPPYMVFLMITLTIAAFMVFTGCEKKEDKRGTQHAPPGNKAANTGTPLEVVKGKEQGKWKAVKIGITDRENNRDIICTIDIGSAVAVPDSGLVIKVDHFLPHFQMKGRKVLSLSDKPKNPAAFITVIDNDRKNEANGNPLELKGYLFSRYPNTALNHPRYNFVLVDFVPTP